MNEFELIKRFCSYQTVRRSDVTIGTGDDCAIVEVPQGYQLAITTDTLIAGVHFPLTTSAYDIGYKALAVNLSDLAAMGASPAWITFALTQSNSDEKWFDELAQGFFALATRYNVQLIGGDLTHGPLSMTLQAQGLTPKGQALTRSNAKPGDLIYVTNTLGDAGLALNFLQKKINVTSSYQDEILTRLNRPEPRVQIGEKLRGIAHAAIDISDGLAADLAHMLEESNVGAKIIVDQILLSKALQETIPLEQALSLALSSGDDYELCFTVPKEKETLLVTALKDAECAYTCIGTITDTHKLDLDYQNGKKYHGHTEGYQHF